MYRWAENGVIFMPLQPSSGFVANCYAICRGNVLKDTSGVSHTRLETSYAYHWRSRP